MISFPNCKINIGLSIIKKRNDGFHNIETVFYPVNLYDALEIIVSKDKKFSFECSGIEIPDDIKNNLCIKAYHLLADEFKLPAVKIHLYKNIPVGAGLGGGSSDAAYTIKLLNDLFQLKLSIAQMQNYASRLGSDCAFFIENKAVFAYEKGNCFEAVDINLSQYKIIIIKPGININTAMVYSGVVPDINTKALKEIISLPIEEWKNHLNNDFEKTIFKKHPEIKDIKNKLYDSGALYALMSGSGSAVYGILSEKINVAGLFPGCFVWQG
ncbi:MAG: 4-(cytidine 5'-diphospho)-2-C-methyl-D-erythritol kinase [Bacteroidales bacterium]|nr:4-(cytidine 5'-diphospho)-2-C-methyl-D-erythritol kinase [Bacteroidales bacterium]